jgi:hypothetical protein
MMFTDFDDFKTQVVKEAQKRNGNAVPICVDDLYEYFIRGDFEGAVEYARMNTDYWNGDIL